MKNPVIFVTGATGFLGGAAVAHLLTLRPDCRVIALVRGANQAQCEARLRGSLRRFDPSLGEKLPQQVEVIPGDLMDSAWHGDSRLSAMTHVIHVAANTSFGQSPQIHKTNVEGALSVARAVGDYPLQRFLYVGTAHISGADAPGMVCEDQYPSPDAEHLVPYTASKAEAETRLVERASHLPLVIARPSMVVGHTELGCSPSGSIFWVCRAVDKLRMITWDPENRIDVIPVDYAAEALAHLLLAPKLRHQTYHISAGAAQSATWREVGHMFASVLGGPVVDRYRRVEFSEINSETLGDVFEDRNDPEYVRSHLLRGQLLKGLELYYRFCGVNAVFDNSRLMEEGFNAPPKAPSWLEACLKTSPASIYEQMLSDF